MNVTKYTVIGVDIIKETFNVFMSPAGQYFHPENMPPGHHKLIENKQLIEKRAPSGVNTVFMEVTSCYQNLLSLTLTLAGIPIAVVNPRQIKNFTREIEAPF